MYDLYDDFMDDDFIQEANDEFNENDEYMAFEEEEDEKNNEINRIVSFIVNSENKSKEIQKKIYLDALKKKESKQLENIGNALDGKLNWKTFTQETDRNDIDREEFPAIGEKVEKPVTKQVSKPKVFKNLANSFRRILPRIKISTLGMSYLIKMPSLCKYAIRKEECAYGNRCIRLHMTPRKICKTFSRLGSCQNSKCPYAHMTDLEIEKEANDLYEEQIIQRCTSLKEQKPAFREKEKPSMSFKGLLKGHKEDEEPMEKSRKNTLCTNLYEVGLKSIKIVKNASCKFDKNCMFAHSKSEVEEVMSKMKRCKKNCPSVVCKEVKGIKIYINSPSKSKCILPHPYECLVNYITRTQSK